METRLYVGNLSDDVSVDALRKRFSECGAVSNVELVFDRSSGRMRGYALVTMASVADARSAMSQLNGSMFDERPLRVNEAHEERGGSRSKLAAQKPAVKITSQFRERLNMAYELDCGGVQLSLKMFPVDPPANESWRVEAVMKNVAGDADTTVSATAATRALAMAEVAKQWAEQDPASGSATLDWSAITEAMSKVRAI